MRHLRLVQLAFALCLAVAFGAMGWVSLRVIELDRAAAGSQRKAQLEENVRLALWRMDSALAPVLAQENARPYAAYRASVFLLSPRNREDVTPIASPLLIPSSDIVELYFHIAPDGAITSQLNQIRPGDHVRLLGRRTSNGNILASSLLVTPSSKTIEIAGPVESVSEPSIVILGVQVNTGSIPPDRFKGMGENPVSSVNFSELSKQEI